MRTKRTYRRNILTGRRPTRKRDLKVGGLRKASGSSSEIVPTFLHMLNTVKLYHWKTTNFATHKATDELYGKLNEKIDEFVEVMLGKREMGGRPKLLAIPIVVGCERAGPLIKLGVYSNNEAFKKQIENYKDFLLKLNHSLGLDLNTDLLAIRDEILAAFNQFLYLLTLA
jgi:hypothetical protein